MDERAVRGALTRIPLVAASAASARLTELAGLSNRVYRVDAGDASYCLRIAGRPPAPDVDREAERHNAAAAADAGVAPRLLYFDAGDGLMLTEFLDGGVTTSPEHFRTRSGAAARAGRALARLHRRSAPFAGRVEPAQAIASCLAALAGRGVPLPDALATAVRASRPVRSALAGAAVTPAPCHCDPTCANLLDDGAEIRLVDWEYSAMCDPAWDLATLACDARLDPGGEAMLLESYLEGAADPSLRARMTVAKPLCALLSALWSLVRLHDGAERRDEIRALYERDLGVARMLLVAPALVEALDALRA